MNTGDPAGIEQKDEGFRAKFDIGPTKGIRSKMLDTYQMKSGPSAEADNTGVLVPKDSIVFALKYFNAEKTWAVDYHGQNGFVPGELVFPVFENEKEKVASKYDLPPQPKSAISPVYPKEAQDKGITGNVYLKIYISEKGKAEDAIILDGVEELNQAAIDAVKKVKYKPALLGGNPVGVWVDLLIKFN